MTDIDDSTPPPTRHKQPWTEQDLEAALEAVREDCPLEDIAERIGRTPLVLRNQLRRMLPADERHLKADLIQARLRQLNRNGDYDWLAAMAQQPKPEWTLQAEAYEQRQTALVDSARSVGVGALSDNDLITLATAILDSQGGFPHDLRRIVATLLQERDLVQDLDRWMRARGERALELLMTEADAGLDEEWYRSARDPYTGALSHGEF